MNFKVKCTGVKRFPEYFTVGKIYEVKNGKVTCDNGWVGDTWSDTINGNGDFEAFKKWFSVWYDFELVEDQPKYKVGDKVRVRRDLRDKGHLYKMDNSSHHGWCAIYNMVALAGKVVTITEYNKVNDCYYVAELEFMKWTDEMFEGLVEEKKEANDMSNFKFKVGDRVIPNAYYGIGHIGTVVCIKEHRPQYGIEFDKPGVGMHNCGGFTLVAGDYPKRGNSLWFYDYQLDLATENNMNNKNVEDNKMKVNVYKVGDKVRLVGYEKSVSSKKTCFGMVTTISAVNENEPYPYQVAGAGWRWCASEFEPVEIDEKIVITHDGKTTTATLYNGDTKVAATARCAPEDDFEFRIGAEIAMARLVDKLVFSKFNVIRVVFREGERAYSYKTRMQTAKVGMEIVVPVGQHHKELRATVVEIIPGAEYDGEYAMSAMKEIDIVEAPKKLYNGKVVCIKTGYSWWTVGKIYEVKDGYITADDHCRYPNNGERYVDADDVRHAGNSNGTKHNYENEFIPIVE